MMGTEQLNIIVHNTLYVPGHFHATVVGGTTLAFMALTYWLVPVLFRREIILPSLAKWQPYLFGLGVTGFTLFMMGAGTLGVPRRHWDISFSQALFQYQYPEVAYLMLGLMAISGILSVVGGGLFVLQVVASVLFGKRKDPVTKSAVPLIAEPVAAGVQGIGIGGISVPGTLVLALVFLTAFILYYFINWKYLSQVWGLS